MKEASPLKQSLQEPHLKVVKDRTAKRKQKITTSKVYINTLLPKFSYKNEKGEVIINDNCILL